MQPVVFEIAFSLLIHSIPTTIVPTWKHQVLLAEEEAVYELLERMMAAVTEPLRAHRIHLGLDETFGLGQVRKQKK